jgi:predicted small lipoprotein YifL
MKKAACLALMFLALAACGTKGDLVLPPAAPEAAPEPAPPAQ